MPIALAPAHRLPFSRSLGAPYKGVLWRRIPPSSFFGETFDVCLGHFFFFLIFFSPVSLPPRNGALAFRRKPSGKTQVLKSPRGQLRKR